MRTNKLILLFCILFSMAVTNALAYDFAVKNADSVMIYYNYINNKAEVEVTYKGIEYDDVYCGSVVIPKDVTYEKKTLKVTGIGKLAFHNSKKLTFVTIPNSVTSIGWAALEGCSSLTSITIPNSVTSIGPDAFSRCSSLTSITIPNSVTNIDDWAFSECSSLTSVTIGNGITNIAHMCFKDCSSLSSITIPNNVTSIGTLAFENCSSLTSINIPNSVTSIGINTFRNCSSLTSITIPNSVTSIGTTTFSGCDNLQKVISKIVAPFAIKDHTFSDETYSNVPLYVPKGTKAKYKTTNGWKNFKNIIEEGTTTGIDAVTALINAIGSVKYTAACKAKIDAARFAYDALTKDEQALVKNYSVLVEVEKAYKQYETTGIADVETKAENKVGKYIVNGKIVIVRNGKKYNLNGLKE